MRSRSDPYAEREAAAEGESVELRDVDASLHEVVDGHRPRLQARLVERRHHFLVAVGSLRKRRGKTPTSSRSTATRYLLPQLSSAERVLSGV